MRLICGLVQFDGTSADRATVDAMIAALTPPGLTPRIATMMQGQAALAVLDFASSSKPRLEADSLLLAADLRLDRASELAVTLDLPESTSERELVAMALARWELDLPDRLDGDFALAAWDAQRRRLICARDVMGVRPLCYAHVAGRFFAFASLPEALQVPGLVPRRFDRLAVAQLAVALNANSAATGYDGIAWLRAGYSLTVSAEGLHLHRAWRPDPAQVGTWRGSPEDAAARLRELMIDAVRQRLPRGADVAAHLSGGLDSSSLTVIAIRLLREQGHRLHAYSMLARPDAARDVLDERRFVEAVLAQEPDISWSEVHVAEPVPFDLRPPLSGAAPGSEDRICAAARAAGCDLVISGVGGDETTSYAGEAIHAALFRQGRWATLRRELPARARHMGQPLLQTIVRRIVAPLAPAALRRWRRRLKGLPPLVSSDRLRFLAAGLRAEVETALTAAPTTWHRAEDRIALLTDSPNTGRCARWATIGARHGIAFTFPLLDRRIVDFMLGLPLDLLVAEGYARQPHRSAMRGILPEAIRLRESKFVPFPDAPLGVAAAKPALLQHVDRLRAQPAATDLFDIEAIARAIAEAPEGDEALAVARAFNRTGASLAFRRAIDAVQVLRLALQVTGAS